ncbi:CLUMA_CG000523, isoform A [Clunio marinus]|uniref:CLUMA_CG000523, isoform A n=1 Tax=Clunio marinus TaxID=568069 RepID=A0A1J1HGL3_9DIPT|nr:CLUMA_CG000523, isoform A [Clunio marinus]
MLLLDFLHQHNLGEEKNVSKKKQHNSMSCRADLRQKHSQEKTKKEKLNLDADEVRTLRIQRRPDGTDNILTEFFIPSFLKESE